MYVRRTYSMHVLCGVLMRVGVWRNATCGCDSDCTWQLVENTKNTTTFATLVRYYYLFGDGKL